MARIRKARLWIGLATAIAVIVAGLLALVYAPLVAVRLIGGGSYTIPSGAMEPTLVPGDWFLALPIGDELPARGSVVVFLHPHRPGVDYVKRLIGFPGETVQLRGGVVYIDGEPARMDRLADRAVEMRRQGSPPRLPQCRKPQPALGADCVQEQWRETLPDGTSEVVLNVVGEVGSEAPDGPSGLDDTPVFTVPAGHVFVLGDHRDNSVDSRFSSVGMVPIANLHHHAWMIHSSFDKSRFLHPRWDRFFRTVH